jgi:hypothetical protein
MKIPRRSRCLLLVFVACSVHLFGYSSGPPPAKAPEISVFKAFVQQHTAWAGGCDNAVLDSSALPIAEGFQPYVFSRERVKPPKELISLLLQTASTAEPLEAPGQPFFRVVDHSVIENLLSKTKCTIDDMQQHKCGWLKFKDSFGKACGYWQFSHITFNADQTQALLKYRLSVYHWGEGGWAFLRRRNGLWHLESVSVGYIT